MDLRTDGAGGVVRGSVLTSLLIAGCATRLPDGDRRPLRDGARALCVAPISGARVASRRPVVRWRAEGEARAVEVEFCADRACARVIARVSASGGTASSETDLPYGPVFWRVRDPTRERSVSPTWWFTIPRGARSAPSAWSWRQRSAVDVDGDGVDDVIDPAGVVRTGPMRGVVLRAPENDLRDGGDIDGDGFADVALAQAIEASATGAVYVYRTARAGGDGGAVAPTWVLRGAVEGELFGDRVVAGDFDGDGFGDLAVGAIGWAQNSGRVRVHRGGAEGVAAVAAWTIESPLGLQQRFRPLAAGDADGDGIDELLTGATGDLGTRGWGFLYGFDARGAFARWTARGAPGSDMGYTGVLLDVDGDDRPEAVLSALRQRELGGCLRLFDGLPDGDGIDVAAVCGTVGVYGIGFGLELADLDGDGAVDVIASAQRSDGRFFFLRGGASVLREEGLQQRRVAVDGAVSSHLSVGDFNGDGYGDVVVFVQDDARWIVWRFLGGVNGLAEHPAEVP